MLRALDVSGLAWKNLRIPWKESLSGVICEGCQNLSDFRPRAYLLLLTVVAVVGYAWLLLFPWLVFASAMGIYHALIGGDAIAWKSFSGWLITGAFAGLASYRQLGFRPELPGGEELENKDYPALYKLAADQSRQYCSIGIYRIVLSGDFDLTIRKIPRFALPVWSTNTLVIGLPLMQILSESQFQCALARRIGQFSKRYNRSLNWLYQLRDTWPQYSRQANFQGIGSQPVTWFFCAYAPLYKMMTVPAARMDELAADTYAMELFSDEHVLNTITTRMVCEHYLAERYWPVARKLEASDARILDSLHTGIAAVLRNGLTRDTIGEWLAKTVSAEQHYSDIVPSLAERVENIGFEVARMSELATRSAAGVYLANLRLEKQ